MVLATFPGPSAAAPAATVQQRAVDMVSLAGGERLFGMFAGSPRGGELQMLVGRAWLRQHAPSVYRKATAGEDERRKAALEQLRDRLVAWRERRTEPKLLTSFLDRSLDETKAALAAVDDPKRRQEPSQLLLVSVPVLQVRKQYRQPPETRRILGLAWEHQIDGAEDLPKAALVERLKAQQIDPAEAQPDLSDRLDVLPLDDRQWAAKMALAEYAVLGQPHFQGSGGLLVRDDTGQNRPALGELIAGMAQSQLEDALGELLGPAGGAKRNESQKLKQAIDKATRSCDDEGKTGARITQLDQDLARRQVTVNDRFLAKMPDGSWQAIWQFASTIDAGKPRPNEEANLAKDPQVAEAVKTIKGLGLDLDPELLRTAMRSGVATQEALAAVDREFADY
ncbi:MAG TPA: hypothetical protein VFX03_11225, partial [Thermomicrobiales bacterium]|nr:hypothetical protein [Thermomicrobiales bacterium]